MDRFYFVLKAIVVGLFTGFINGLFGSGGGTIIVPALVFLFGIEQQKSHATALLIILPLSIISSFIYFNNQLIDYPLTLKVSFGAIFGSYIGAKTLSKIPNKLLRKIFGVFMILAALRMVM
ncbi:sulfite exporter TauE/SafE family protein [Irregularibacter muris]|uniref:Probable membrane transporter protein n=1 Tax=Irregularibacter muris TaxID=1796619 RepID=A0AAE3HD81_9FIRM|nr:sulfite exporter TauE/SafE family protein [Irregularibacter muris]MCR1898221.1 sulfite exporter TauE/SafE family protein [Irregularibacter muris]